MAEVKKYGRGRPKKGEVRDVCFDKDGYRKNYYDTHQKEMKIYGLLMYYRRKYKMPDEEYEMYIKFGMTPEKILLNLKEKSLMEKMKKLHEPIVQRLPETGTVPTLSS
jgi:hypothetical protein